ncbi:MBL fold metallo-hydrolase [Streptomyces sp. RFCAC02]|uniref:MBL fold metallo-hydrolase n=1 Tax=Streptomyces sp. RFCAC02 TaxID=2499143 RepID=UPI00143E0CE6|nr:MBL fold metallo-hydrolase [Streptomyces sp. RFCAC02]
MEIRLLGTGSADGWPNPWCTCRSCAWARATPGAERGQTTVLVDGTLLIDTGSARRSRVPLDRVRTVLFTHAHPDHADPQPLLWRQYAEARRGAEAPLEIAGPPAALDLCRDWVRPGSPVTWTPLTAGQCVRLASGHRVRALAADHWRGDPYVGPALLYAVDDRLLAAWDTGEKLPDVEHPTYDVVLLDCNDGLRPGTGEHHDLAAFARTVAALRARGAVGERTRVVAVALGCANPPGPELDAILARCGASAPFDGTVLTVPPDGAGVSGTAPPPSSPRAPSSTRPD